MVDCRPARLARLDLDPADVAVLGEAGIGDEVDEQVGALGRHHHVLLHLDDQVGFAVLPGVTVGPLDRRRQVGGVAAWGAAVDPSRDHGDLLVAQARVRFVDTDRPVDVPGRHLPGLDAALDGPRPGPDLLVGEERHRRGGLGPVAALAGALEDRRDVAAEGRRVGVGRRGRRGSRSGQEREGQNRGRSQQGECVLHRSLPVVAGSDSGSTQTPRSALAVSTRLARW